eukprot:TRINITY_DN44421_c0_g1_i1.p1 TRINITY_DN44421_c0_g1~~TRINITY_DN44421_c0_g1_i1.p1  ORF type:complete len:840 (-),score=199.78 TRINITY_DN44421_c0_g1_i1:123-2642(-)
MAGTSLLDLDIDMLVNDICGGSDDQFKKKAPGEAGAALHSVPSSASTAAASLSSAKAPSVSKDIPIFDFDFDDFGFDETPALSKPVETATQSTPAVSPTVPAKSTPAVAPTVPATMSASAVSPMLPATTSTPAVAPTVPTAKSAPSVTPAVPAANLAPAAAPTVPTAKAVLAVSPRVPAANSTAAVAPALPAAKSAPSVTPAVSPTVPAAKSAPAVTPEERLDAKTCISGIEAAGSARAAVTPPKTAEAACKPPVRKTAAEEEPITAMPPLAPAQSPAQVQPSALASVEVVAVVDPPANNGLSRETAPTASADVKGQLLSQAVEAGKAVEDPKPASPASTSMPEQVSEKAMWERRVLEQQEALGRSQRARAEVRASVEKLQQRIAWLTTDCQRLRSGGIGADIVARRAALRQEVEELNEAQRGASIRTREAEASKAAVEKACAEAVAASVAANTELEDARKEEAALAAAVGCAQDARAAAKQRLQNMVHVDRLQACEAEVIRDREDIATALREARQLRVALAEAISSGTDLPNTLKELSLLKESAELAGKRIVSLEEFNSQLEGRVQQINEEIRSLRKGTVDLRSEGELMRDVIIEQSEQLLQRVEFLTDESRTAKEDRKQLLGRAADLMARVDEIDARIACRSEKEADCAKMEAGQQNLNAEVERLRRTNNALCQQVSGEDAEGSLVGALKRPTMHVGDENEALLAEVLGFINGKPTVSDTAEASGPAGARVKADAAVLALRVQQVLAEREESFWVERQRLSDRVIALERARGGRTGSLLREYDSKARGDTSHGGAVNGGTASVGGYTKTASAAAGKAADVVAGRLRRLKDAAMDQLV